ncbi:Transthyretin-like family protein, partial [Cooperia oncophora]
LAILSWLDPHDVLAEGYSDSSGEFRLAGATEELTAMEPVLEIYTDCNDGIKSWESPGMHSEVFWLILI